MFTKCPMTKLMKNYQLFTFWWLKSLYPALTNMSDNISTLLTHDTLVYLHGPCMNLDKTWDMKWFNHNNDFVKIL